MEDYDKIKIVRKGLLTKYGYKISDTAGNRHIALQKAAKEYGAGNLVLKLNAICVLNKNRSPSQSAKYCADKRWVERVYNTDRTRTSRSSSAKYSPNRKTSVRNAAVVSPEIPVVKKKKITSKKGKVVVTPEKIKKSPSKKVNKKPKSPSKKVNKKPKSPTKKVDKKPKSPTKKVDKKPRKKANKPADPELYEKVKKEIIAKNPVHSAYRSGAIVKEYKKRGGTYTGTKPKKTGLTRWFEEDWKSQSGNYGYKKKGDIYRPTVRVTSKTPITMSELTEKEKKRAMYEKKTKGRVRSFSDIKKKY